MINRGRQTNYPLQNQAFLLRIFPLVPLHTLSNLRSRIEKVPSSLPEANIQLANLKKKPNKLGKRKKRKYQGKLPSKKMRQDGFDN